MELRDITYNYIVELAKYFITVMKNTEQKEFALLVRRVKSKCPEILNMGYVFDETIWPSNEMEKYENLVEFRIQLYGIIESMPFKLYLNKGQDQKAIHLIDETHWLKH